MGKPEKKISKPGFGWKCYLTFAAIINLLAIIDFFTPKNTLHTYYEILSAFDVSFKFMYYTNMLCIIINVLSLAPLFLYVYQRRFLPPFVWKLLFAARVIFDVTGHSYELVFIKSMFHSSPWNTIQFVLAGLLVAFPSYFAHYIYAFRQNKVIPSQGELFMESF